MPFYLTQLSQKSLPSELPPSAALPSARAWWQSLEHRCRSLTTSARLVYKSTRICRLMRKSMQSADRVTVTITFELCDRTVTICRSILPRQWLVPSSVRVLTTVTRSFTTSHRRTFKSYRDTKKSRTCSIESTEIDVAQTNAGLIALITCHLQDTV